MKKKLVLLGCGLAIGIIVMSVVFFVSKKPVLAPSVACTLEAKVCPDGTSVGRVAPSCEFAPCPTVATTSTSTPVTDGRGVRIGSTITQDGISITPISVVDDSRCPSDVRCVWAGTTHVSVQLSSGTISNTVTLELGSPTDFAGKTVTLSSVFPAPSSKTQIEQSAYRFMFDVGLKAATAQGTLQGTVEVKPACPVERIDTPCTPSPEMYAAQKIAVYTSTDESKLVTTITPDAQGQFSLPLPVGKYYLDRATKTSVGSTEGLPTSVVINEGALVELKLSVDTGIR